MRLLLARKYTFIMHVSRSRFRGNFFLFFNNYDYDIVYSFKDEVCAVNITFTFSLTPSIVLICIRGGLKVNIKFFLCLAALTELHFQILCIDVLAELVHYTNKSY